MIYISLRETDYEINKNLVEKAVARRCPFVRPKRRLHNNIFTYLKGAARELGGGVSDRHYCTKKFAGSLI
jgi:hypothetical protein